MGPMKARRDIKAELGLTEVQQADIRKAMESAKAAQRCLE